MNARKVSLEGADTILFAYNFLNKGYVFCSWIQGEFQNKKPRFMRDSTDHWPIEILNL